MNHERRRLSPNPYIKMYRERLGDLGSFAINTAKVINHELRPPQIEPKMASIKHFGKGGEQ